MNSFEQKLNALREEALAKNTVAYGEKAAKYIDSAEVRSRQMARKLKSVEALPGEAAALLLDKADGE